MKKILKVLKFFRITDEKDLLSLTNLAVMVGIYKIIVTNATSMNDLGLFLIPLLNYAYKKTINKE